MAEIPQITSEDTWQMLLDDDTAVLVDVRTETEWRTIGVPDTSETGRDARFVHWTDEQGSPNPHFIDLATDGLERRHVEDVQAAAPVAAGTAALGAHEQSASVGRELVWLQRAVVPQDPPSLAGGLEDHRNFERRLTLVQFAERPAIEARRPHRAEDVRWQLPHLGHQAGSVHLDPTPSRGEQVGIVDEDHSDSAGFRRFPEAVDP